MSEKFYCFKCGGDLIEIGLGFYECLDCGEQFLSTINEFGHQIMIGDK